MKGNVWRFGDDVDTDAIIPGRYLTINDPKKLANHLFEGVRPGFAREVKPGDIIVAGKNFGCGSSREHAPLALNGAGIKCVIAKSFAGIFFRNAINTGLPILECAETERIKEGDILVVDFRKGFINNKTTGETHQATPMPEFVRKIIECGGLIKYTRAGLSPE
ncbi:MAG: 3-isopropylmalate dehydratase small subunit [Methanosarcinales archaeon Met12]|nr:MAG: 3-isopropylmalate dehydratase small subunit [Methanosarcinales archaeon Met12]